MKAVKRIWLIGITKKVIPRVSAPSIGTMAQSTSIYDFVKVRLSWPSAWRLFADYLGGDLIDLRSGYKSRGPLPGKPWGSTVLWKETYHGQTQAMTDRKSANAAAIRIRDALCLVETFSERMRRESFFLAESLLFPRKKKIQEAIETIFHYHRHPQPGNRMVCLQEKGWNSLPELKRIYASTAFILKKKDYHLLSSIFPARERRFLAKICSSPGNPSLKDNGRLCRTLHLLAIHQRNHSSDQIETLQIRMQREYRQLLRSAERFLA